MALRKKVPVPRKTKLNLSRQRNFTEFVICWSWPKLSNWKPQINQTTTVYTMEYGAIMPNIHPSFHIYLQSWFTLHLSLSIVDMHLNRDTSWLTHHSCFTWAGPVTVSPELVGQGQVMVNSTLAIPRDRLSLPVGCWRCWTEHGDFLESNIPIDLRLSGGIEKYKWILFAPWVQTLSCVW